MAANDSFSIKQAYRRRWGLLLSFCLFCLVLNAGSARGAVWFPSDSVSCRINSPSVNMGAYSTIPNPAPVVDGQFDISCTSEAYPGGYPSSYHTAEASYCLTIKGARELHGEGGNAHIVIPFDFYSRIRNISDPRTPIGDGTYGIAFLDWKYADGDKHAEQPVTMQMDGNFSVVLKPALQGALPAGIYSNHFTFLMKSGATRRAQDYPTVNKPDACSLYPGGITAGSVKVMLIIKKYCHVDVAQHINFGTHMDLARDIFAHGAVSVDCSASTRFGVGLGRGLHSSGTGQRFLQDEQSGRKVRYDLYQDSACTRPWTNAWGSPDILKGTGSGNRKQYHVYAAVPSQPVSAGTYTDTVIVEVKVLDDGTVLN